MRAAKTFSLLSRSLALGAVAVVVSPASQLHAERYHYDAPGRLIRVVYDDLSSITYTYDPNGNITAVTVTEAGDPGDADGDGNIDQDDIDIILQTTLDGGEPYGATADCNLDDQVSVLDLVCAIGTGPPVATGTPRIAAVEVDAMRGDAVQIPVSLSGVSGVARALQFDLLFDPAVVGLGTVTPQGALADHLVASATPVPGLLRLVIYSPTNAALTTGDLAEIAFDVAVAAPFGKSLLGLAAAQVAGPDAAALAPVTLVDGEVQVFSIEADLAVTKTASRTLVDDGDPLTYTVRVDNTGPADVTGADVTDLVPYELVSVTWSCAPSGGGSCTSAGALDVVDSVDIPTGDAVTYTIDGIVDSAVLSFDNTAEVAAPAEALDATGSNDSDTATVHVCLGPETLEVTNENVSTVEAFVASGTLTVGPNFNVLDGGEAALRACGSVVLTNGVAVEIGGQLTVDVRAP